MGKGKRILEIDALRGLAVLLMVFSHGLHWAYTGTAHDIISLFGILSPGDIAAPIFYFTAGLSLYYSLTTLSQRDHDLTALQRRYTSRLAKLFFIGVTLSLTWGVLQAQAVTIFILVTTALFLQRRLDFRQVRPYILALIALALGLHLFLVSFAPHLSSYSILGGQFPVFAILTLNAAGFYFAPSLRLPKLHYRCLVAGAAFMAAALVLAKAGFPLERFNAPAAFIIMGIGLSLMLLGILNLSMGRDSLFFPYLTRVGRDALFLFVFHYLVFYVPLFLSGFMERMGPAVALGFSSVMVLAITITARLRDHSSFSVYHLVDTLLLVLSQGRGYLTGDQLPADLKQRSAAG